MRRLQLPGRKKKNKVPTSTVVTEGEMVGQHQSMDMSLRKLREMVKDVKPGPVLQSMGSHSRTQLSDRTTTTSTIPIPQSSELRSTVGIE